MVIFNSWGQRIFETRKPSEGWDGKDAPTGVYRRVISCSDLMEKVVQIKEGGEVEGEFEAS